jgi:hypothetical protein
MSGNARWDKEQKTVKATQVAFALEQQVAQRIQTLAVAEGLTTSSEIRKLLGLSYSPPKRPRLTVSLSAEDYQMLADKYQLDASNTMDIRRRMIAELIERFAD